MDSISLPGVKPFSAANEWAPDPAFCFWERMWTDGIIFKQRTLPKEVLLLIILHLDVTEFLTLTRVSKASCIELIHSSYNSTWNIALERYEKSDVPGSWPLPCPPYLRPWRYAEMVLTDICEYCRKVELDPHTLFRLCAKVCKECASKYAKSEKRIEQAVLAAGEDFPASILLTNVLDPMINRTAHWGPFYYLSPDNRAGHEYLRLDPMDQEAWVRQCRTKVTWASEIVGKLYSQLRIWKGPQAKTQTVQERNAVSLQLGALLERDEQKRTYKRGALHRQQRREEAIIAMYQIYKTNPVDAHVLVNGHKFFPPDSMIFSIKKLDWLRKVDITDITIGWEMCLPDVELALRNGTTNALEEVKHWYKACHIATVGKGGDSKTEGRNATRHAGSPGTINMDNTAAVFTCSKCKWPLWLETFLSHQHFVDSYLWKDTDPFMTTHTKTRGIAPASDIHRGPGNLQYNTGLTEIVTGILLQSTNINRTSSIKELLGVGERYICALCDSACQKPIEFDHLVLHFRNTKHPITKRRAYFRLLTAPKAKKQLAAYQEYVNGPQNDGDICDHEALESGRQDSLICRHCGNGTLETTRDLMIHLYDHHGLLRPDGSA